MRIAYIAAGAGGMYCGSCIRDNALAAAMQRAGHEVLLLPIYTPLRTDDENVSLNRVFYGAVNVYLEQKARWFGRLPRRLRRWLDSPSLIRAVTKNPAATDARELGDLTLSVLRGEEGRQRVELERLVAWLEEFDPDIVQLTNSMLLGMAGAIARALPRARVVCTFQGEDLFLDDLDADHHDEVVAEMRRHAGDCHAFLATSSFYREAMAELLQLDPDRVHVTRTGIQLAGFPEAPRAEPEGPPWAIGFMARICPEKGLHVLVDAFRLLAERRGAERVVLRVGGWLGGRDRAYWLEQKAKLERWGLLDRLDARGEVDRAGKIEMLRSLHLLSVPTVYREPKGLPVLEALATGVPVVQPEHGVFPEILAETGGGTLVEPENPEALAAELDRLLSSEHERAALSAEGFAGVRRRFPVERMAEETLAAYETTLGAGGGRAAAGASA